LIGSSLRERLKKDKRFKLLLDEKFRFFDSPYHYDLYGERIRVRETNILHNGVVQYLKKNLPSDTIIINCIGVEGNERCSENPELAVDSNFFGVSRLVEVVNKVGCKLIHFSTTEINRPVGWVSDKYSYVYEISPTFPRTIYSKTKYAADNIIKLSLPKDNYVIVKPGLVYGEMPHDTYSYFKRIMERIYLQQYVDVNFDKKLLIQTNPLFQKDFLFHRHVVDMIMHIIDNINLCTGSEMFLSRNQSKPFISYLTIIEEIMKINNINDFVEFDDSKDQTRKHSPIAKRFYEFFPGFQLDKGVYDDRTNLTHLYYSIADYYNDNYIRRVIKKQQDVNIK
jgi:dTDP-4-dehydrorhamnose reductase